MKKIMFVFLISLVGCSDRDNSNDIKQKIDVQTVHWIVLKNSLGENLLDPNVSNSYLHDSIMVFSVNSDGSKLILQKNLVESSSEIPYFLRIGEFGINDETVNESTVFLKLSTTDIDTIKVEYKIESSNLFTTKLWYNGQLKWLREYDKPIEIVKK